MMARDFSPAVKRAAFLRCKGNCEGCCKSLASGDIRYDHIVPYAMSFDSSLENCQVLCTSCHADKTAGRDLPNIAKAKRQEDFHHGVTGPGLGRSPMACGRRSRRRKTFHHGVVERETQSEAHRRMMAERYPEGLR